MKHLFQLFLLLLLSSPVVAKDWSIDQLTLRALVQPDGTIEFRETRTYRFEGSYSRAEYEIRKQGFDRHYDIEVWMDGVQMTESDSKDPGTFRVRDRSSRVVVEWFYAAEDTSTVFEVRYNVAGAIVAGPEHSELFWTFIGTKWDRSTQASDIRVEFVNAARSATIPFWVEGGIDELLSESGENGKVEIGTGFVPRRDGLRIRMVFPTAWIPDAPITHFDFTLEQAMADELRKDEQRVVDAQQDVAIAEFINELLPLLIFGPMLTFGYFYHRYGRRFSSPVRIPETGHTPPSDLPPAVASWMVMSGYIYPQAMVATLLDLARRGYITLNSEDEPQRFGKPKTVTSVALTEQPAKESDLQDFELTLYRYIESHASDGSVRLPDLFPPNKSATTKWYAAWAAQAKANADSRGVYDKASTKGVALSAIVCGVLLIASIFAAAYIGTLGVIGLVMSSIFLIASFFIYRRTENGEIIYRLWWAYRNGLKSGNKSDLADVTVGRHLVYAIAFGFAGKKLTNILDQMDVDPNSDQWLSVSGFMHNPALFSSQISGMVASASAGVSSASGASAGSAGGGGGGGAS
jgi:uncharacterized membrane protein